MSEVHHNEQMIQRVEFVCERCIVFVNSDIHKSSVKKSLIFFHAILVIVFFMLFFAFFSNITTLHKSFYSVSPVDPLAFQLYLYPTDDHIYFDWLFNMHTHILFIYVSLFLFHQKYG